MGIPDVIIEQILDVDSDAVVVFYTLLHDIFHCTRDDILSFCETLDDECLSKLREYLFVQLRKANPEINDKELCHRRKKSKVIDDIYILGYCLINGLEDRRLQKTLKCDNGKISDITSVNDGDFQENIALSVCAELKSEINKLKNSIKCMEARIVTLQNENCELKLKMLDGDVQKQARNELRPSLPKNKIKVFADVHKDKDGVTQLPQTEQVVTLMDTKNVDDDDKNRNESPFRHSKWGRNKILKGLKLSRDNEQNTTKSANATKKFQIEAAPQTDKRISKSETYLIYIGKLSEKTDENSLRAHLLHIGLKNQDISDVLKLNTRRETERSFCVSVDSKRGQDLIFDRKNNWPVGVRIRPFKPNLKGSTPTHWGNHQARSTSRYISSHKQVRSGPYNSHQRFNRPTHDKYNNYSIADRVYYNKGCADQQRYNDYYENWQKEQDSYSWDQNYDNYFGF